VRDYFSWKTNCRVVVKRRRIEPSKERQEGSCLKTAGLEQKDGRLIATTSTRGWGMDVFLFALSLIVVDWLGRDRHVVMIGGRGVCLDSPYG
jgi:hypothetical protein